MIAIQGLSYRISGSSILSDVSLELPQGGTIALIGPNGAGKSTLLNHIARLSPIQSGRIIVDGCDIAQTAPRDLALKLAIVSQSPSVPSRLRVRDLVTFGRWPHHRGRPSSKDIQVVDAVLTEFGLSDLADRFLDELSGGQQQRAFVAMGFAQDTDWLLLDEPLNNLDMHHARRLMAHVRKRTRPQAKGTKTVVMVVHEINYVAAWADYVVALKRGSVEMQGPTKDVLTSNNLSDLFEMEIRVQDLDGTPLVLHHI